MHAVFLVGFFYLVIGREGDLHKKGRELNLK